MSTTESERPAPVLDYRREHNTLQCATASPTGAQHASPPFRRRIRSHLRASA
jgi:hypothetical protein